MHTPCKNKTLHLKFFKSLNKLLVINFIAAILIAVIVTLILFSKNKFSNEQESALLIAIIANAFVITAPLVLFVLCVVSSAVFSVKLSKKNIYIRNLNNLESLSKVDVICLEKTNVITDGTLEIQKIIPLQAVATEQYINQWLSNLLRATNNVGAVFDALNKKYDFELSAGVVDSLSFDEKIKYIGATFKGGKTFVLGSPEFVPVKNKIGIIKRCEEYLNKGCRVLVLGEGKEQITSDGYYGELEGIVLIVLKDHISKNAFETFKWLKENNIKIKVISSDDALVVSAAAAEAGVGNADKFLTLGGLNINQAKDLIAEYCVFGEMDSEQKSELINILKEENQQVMMIGGSDCGVLPMKSSNFSISITDKKNELAKASDIVFKNASLDLIPFAIESSNSFINSLQKIIPLALAKMIVSFLITILFVSFSNDIKQCLFVFNHVLLLDLIINGIASLLLVLNKTKPQAKKKAFTYSVLKNTIPIALLQIVGMLTVLALYAMQKNNLLSVGIYSFDSAIAMSLLLLSIFSVVSLYNICCPLNKRRTIIFSLTTICVALLVAAAIIASYFNIIETPYKMLNGPMYFIVALISVIYSAIYMFAHQIIRIVKGDNYKDEN